MLLEPLGLLRELLPDRLVVNVQCSYTEPVQVTVPGSGGPGTPRLDDIRVGADCLVFEETGWVEATLSEPVAVVHYALISANDAPGRDPKDWTLSGSNDGESWTRLDSRADQDFPDRFQ